ncbi:hypothetical protein CKM354_000646500 [Cercospora kikuchii]|uniref:Uncharacterized protein n=1 Tax=Cercospora kikuchii TaxID=84275 RepID=A0A9P3FDF6_9PEZI|nr:uncharacterized protein CKM354_000646500 [Cercospora kikuchii]GIZ43233.1 hypothetical protein CKM354_000646500 [Cercospora kikuchii]
MRSHAYDVRYDRDPFLANAQQAEYMSRDQHEIESAAGLEEGAGTRTPSLLLDDFLTTSKTNSQDALTPPRPMQLDEKTLESIAPFLRQATANEINFGVGANPRALPAQTPDEQHPSNDEEQTKCWLRRVIAGTASRFAILGRGHKVDDCTCWMCDWQAFTERCEYADRLAADLEGDAGRRNAR